MGNASRRPAFTLVETLVVIATSANRANGVMRDDSWTKPADNTDGL